MSRRGSGPRLRWSKDKYEDGKLRRRGEWLIIDGADKKRTGCAKTERVAAEKKLIEYIAGKHQAPAGKRHPAEILVTEVLKFYQEEKVAHWARKDLRIEAIQRLDKLADFFEEYTLGNINGPLCRQYVAWRTKQTVKSSGSKPRKVTTATARRELEDLRAAINFHRKEGYCSEIISVALPPKGKPRVIWLNRSEVAKLVLAAWRAKQEFNGADTKRAVGQHIARFILVAYYTGTRHEAICRAAFTRAIGRGYVDLERGVFFRQAHGVDETKKQQPPVRLPSRLLNHIRRWHRLRIAVNAVVEWNGRPVASVRKGFEAAVEASGLEAIVRARLGVDGVEVDKITPHVMRHTAATRLMQKGEDLAIAAGFLGMTEQTLRDVYFHHHPDFQKDVAERMGRK